MLKSFNEYFEANKHDNPPINYADVEPLYQTPSFPAHPDAGTLPADQKIYNGNCHCGAVTYAVKTTPLEEQKVMNCNCSLCSRVRSLLQSPLLQHTADITQNGDLWIDPPKSAITVHGGENLTDYAFLSKESLHSFCKICGISVLVRVSDEAGEKCPINVRTIDGVDLASLTLRNYDGAKNDPQYEV